MAAVRHPPPGRGRLRGRGRRAADPGDDDPAAAARRRRRRSELIGAAAAEGLLQHEAAAIAGRAGGNPLFLQELVASSGAPGDEALPESVEAVVATRIDKLQPGDRALLRYAAVLGASFSSELVGEVLADDSEASADSAAWDRLGEFVERDPYTAGAFRFRHALFRDAAYEGLSYKRRGELHAKVGERVRAARA